MWQPPGKFGSATWFAVWIVRITSELQLMWSKGSESIIGESDLNTQRSEGRSNWFGVNAAEAVQWRGRGRRK